MRQLCLFARPTEVSMYDVHLERPASADAIQEAVAVVFGVLRSDVRLCVALEELPHTADAKVACVWSNRRGQFPLHLQIFPQRAELTASAEEDVAHVLSQRFQCSALISDDSANPYVWRLVRGLGPVQTVHVDVPAFDERDELIVCRVVGEP